MRTRNIKEIKISFQTGNVKILSLSFPLERFIDFLDNNSSIPELERYLEVSNFYPANASNQIFKGIVKFPQYFWGMRPELKNHVGAPEAFYSGQLGIQIGGGINFERNSILSSNIVIGLFKFRSIRQKHISFTKSSF